MSAWRASRAKRLVLLYLYLYIGMAEIYTDPKHVHTNHQKTSKDIHVEPLQ